MALNKLQRALLIVLCVFAVHIFPNSQALANQDLFEVRQLNKKALILYRLQKFEEALPLAGKALRLMERIRQPRPVLLVQTLNNLAELKRQTEDFVSAETLLLRSLNVAVQSLGETHTSVPIICNNLALLYENFGKIPEAQAFYQHSLKIVEKKLGVDHPKVVSLALKLAALVKKRSRQNM